MTLTILLLLSFYCFSAIMEGYLFHYRMNASSYSRNKHEHLFLTLMRSPVWLMALATLSLWDVAGMVLIFPFVHDGVYYVTRHKLDDRIYQSGFFSYSKDDTARLSFTLIQRSILAGVGIGVMVVF